LPNKQEFVAKMQLQGPYSGSGHDLSGKVLA